MPSYLFLPGIPGCEFSLYPTPRWLITEQKPALSGITLHGFVSCFPFLFLQPHWPGLALPKECISSWIFASGSVSRGPTLFLNWLVLEYIQWVGTAIARHSPVHHFVQHSSETHVGCGFPSVTPIICELEPTFCHLALSPVDVLSV